jgi:hypothetical protein
MHENIERAGAKSLPCSLEKAPLYKTSKKEKLIRKYIHKDNCENHAVSVFDLHSKEESSLDRIFQKWNGLTQ